MIRESNQGMRIILLWILAALSLINSMEISLAQEQDTTQPNQIFLPLIVGKDEVVVQQNIAPQESTEGAIQPPLAETDQIIVQYYKTADAVTASSADRVVSLSQAVGVELSYVREMDNQAMVLKLPSRLNETKLQDITARLAALPDIEYAEPDALMQPMLTPNDPRYNEQWHYFAPSTGNYGVNLPLAWDITTGSTSVVVAVLDTGILNHADLAGRTVAGYDFINDIAVANDGNGRDNNPLDPGDWVTAAESASGPLAGCDVENSSWHGSHVAGTIGAKSNNSLGVAGVNWQAKIQPLRVLGKCGGYISDIADAIRWAAGLSVSGVPANTTPAKVMNLSLGGGGSCSTTYQSAITAAVNAGTVVVVSAGNENSNAANYQPASCTGVITVASSNRAGNRASYSNYGATVEISAPGGDSGNGVLSTLNTGTTIPASDSYAFYQGTSMAAPHVAGIVSLMFSVKSTLTPAQVLNILQTTRTAFPAGSTCTTAICGPGIINAAAAVSAAQGGTLLAPSNLNATTIASSQINLTWLDNASSETGFKIERCQGANCTNFTQIATVGANVTTYANTGLTANTSYSYRVRATQNTTDSAYSNTATATTSAANCTLYNSTNVPLAVTDYSTIESTLSVPSNLSITDINLANLRITHTYDGDLVANLISPAGRIVRLFTNIGGSGDDFTNTWFDDAAGTPILNGTPPFTGRYRPAEPLSTFNGQIANGTWRLQIADTASSDQGSLAGWGLEICGTTSTLPAAPSNLSASIVSTTQINLSWLDNSNNESGFKLERSNNGTSGWSQIATVGSNVTSYANTGLTCGTTYYYRARAYSSGGDSAYSNVASAQLPCTSSNIFADSFESGNTAAWSFVNNGSRISVNSQAARIGSYGAQVTIDPATAVYLADDRPAAEPRYRARFYFHPNSITLANKITHPIFYGVQGSGTSVMRIGFQKASNKYQVRAGLLNDGTTWKFTSWYTISNDWHVLEVDWLAATSTSAKNGSLTFWLDGAQKATVSKIDNDTRRIDASWLGWLGPTEALGAGTQGSYYFDDFVSRRLNYIGPASGAQSAAIVEPEVAAESVSEEVSYPAITVATTVQPGMANRLTSAFSGLQLDADLAVNTRSEPITGLLVSTDTQTMPDGYTLLGEMFTLQLQRVDGTFIYNTEQPTTLTINYATLFDGAMPAGEVSLQAWNRDAEIWEMVPATVNTADHTITALIAQPVTLAVWQKEQSGGNMLYLPTIQR